jgi:hypothetical protein
VTALTTSVNSPSVRMMNGGSEAEGTADENVEHPEHERDAEQRDAVAV